MRKHLLLTKVLCGLSVCLLISGSAAQAQGQKQTNKGNSDDKVSLALQKYDQNRNNRWDSDEKSAYQRDRDEWHNLMLRLYDRNKNQQLDDSEREDMRRDRRQHAMDDVYDRYDFDADGKLSPKERREMKGEFFEQEDLYKNEGRRGDDQFRQEDRHDRKDRPEPRTEAQMKTRRQHNLISMYDVNRDGKLDKDEKNIIKEDVEDIDVQ